LAKGLASLRSYKEPSGGKIQWKTRTFTRRGPEEHTPHRPRKTSGGRVCPMKPYSKSFGLSTGKSLTTSFGITFLMIYLLIVFESLFKPTSISNFLHAWLCLPISLFFCGLSAFINWLKFLCATLTELLLV